MSLSVEMECRTGSDNECSGFAQSAESVHARITSHYSCTTNALLQCQTSNIAVILQNVLLLRLIYCEYAL